MDRTEFLRACALLGISVPLGTAFSACSKEEDEDPGTGTSGFSGKVLIIGAGPAGLCAGHFLNQRGIDFEIVEASSMYGGRTRTDFNFVDFPIPLGAEWVHVNTSIFDTAVNDSSVTVNVPTTMYNQSTDYGLWDGQQLSVSQMGFSGDSKFIGGTWFTFLQQYIAPSVAGRITYNTVVQSVDYSGGQITVGTNNGSYTADRVVVAVPVKILQNGVINFTPALPSYKQDAINNATVWDGFKAFIEFSTKFYPAFFGNSGIPANDGQKLYYDAAYGQNSTRHVLGLFTVGTPATQLAALSDSDLRDFMLMELDNEFSGQATPNYIQHTSQNWNAEPHINGAYVYDNENWQLVRDLGRSVADKVYFAGDAYTEGNDWSSVHTAIGSAKRAIEELVAG